MIPSFSSGLIISQFWRWIIKLTRINVSMTYPGVPFIGTVVMLTGMGPGMLLLSVAIKNIDPAQYEAARLDGATWRQIKLRIIAPQVMKQFSVLLLFGIVGSLQIWETIYMLAPFEATSSMMFRVIQDGFMFGKYGFASAECVIMVAVIILLTKVKERVEGK